MEDKDLTPKKSEIHNHICFFCGLEFDMLCVDNQCEMLSPEDFCCETCESPREGIDFVGDGV